MIETGDIFAQPSVCASKQPTNLHQPPIRNTITDDEPECNKACGEHKYKFCKHINTATKEYINHNTVTSGYYNWDSTNVVYLINCQNA